MILIVTTQSETIGGSARRNQQLTQFIRMLNLLPRQLQPMVIQITIILARRRQLAQVQFDRKLPFFAPSLQQQSADQHSQVFAECPGEDGGPDPLFKDYLRACTCSIRSTSPAANNRAPVCIVCRRRRRSISSSPSTINDTFV